MNACQQIFHSATYKLKSEKKRKQKSEKRQQFILRLRRWRGYPYAIEEKKTTERRKN